MTTTGQETMSPVAAEGTPGHERLRPLVVASAALVALFVVARLAYRVTSAWIVEPYKAPLWWVTYDTGFVRRGLPGTVLAWFGPPTPASMTLASSVLALTACAAIVALAHRLVAVIDEPTTRTTVAVVVLASPFSLPLMIRDVGRYDAIGVAAIAGIAALSPRLARPSVVAVLAVSASLAVAAGSEEFLVLFAVPVVAALACRWFTSVACRLGVLATTLGPALVVAVAGVATRADRASLLASSHSAHVAGVLPADEVDVDAATVLGYSIREQLTIFTEYPWPWLVVLLVGGATLSSLVGALVWIALGRPRGAAVAAATSWLGAAALALSVVGVDFLRWWGLALLGLLAFLAVTPRSARSTRPAVPPAALVVVVLTGILLWQLAPIGPPPR